MAPFRNFLARRSGVPNGAKTESSDENVRPAGSNRSTPLSFESGDKTAPPEYKLSGMWLSLIVQFIMASDKVRPLNQTQCATVVDDNGSYLPVFPVPRSRIDQYH